MNIVHVIPYFHPAKRFGGAPEAVYDLVRAQARLGHEITVLTSDAGIRDAAAACDFCLKRETQTDYAAKGSADRLTIYYFPNRWLRLTERYKIFTASYGSRRLWDKVQPHVLHLHEVHIPGYRSIARYARQNRIPVVLSPHGSLAPPVHSGIKKLLHHWGDRILRYPWFERIHTYISLCENETRQFVQCGADRSKIQKISYGLPRMESGEVSLPFSLVSSREWRTLLYLGRISRAKGCDTLCEASIRLWRQQRRFRLLFCGHDEHYVRSIQSRFRQQGIPCFEGRVEDQPGICILPAIPRKGIAGLFRMVDVTVCPSPYESFGLVPIESLLCDAPILVTTGYGFLDYVTPDHPCVRIVPPRDATALTDALASALTRDKPQIDTRTLTIPSWDEIAERHIHLYQAALQSIK